MKAFILAMAMFTALFTALPAYAETPAYNSRQCVEASKAFQVYVLTALAIANIHGQRGKQYTDAEYIEKAQELADQSLKVTVACFGVGEDVSFPLLEKTASTKEVLR